MSTITVTNISPGVLYCRTPEEEYALLPGVETPVDAAAFAQWCRRNPAFLALLNWPGKVDITPSPFS